MAGGLATISSKGENLPQVAMGMMLLVTAISMGAANLTAFNMALLTMAGMTANIVTSVEMLKEAFNGFVITPPDITPFIAAFSQIIVYSSIVVSALTAVGISAGSGMASGISAGFQRAQSIVTSSVYAMIAAMNMMTVSFTLGGMAIGNGFASAIRMGFSKVLSIVSQSMSQITVKFAAASITAYSCGRNIGKGLAKGMNSTLGEVRAAAASLAAAAEAAIRAKAKIHSPSKVTEKLGGYYGEGWINSIKSKVAEARKWAERLVYMPDMRASYVAFAGSGGSLSDDYRYGSGRSFVIEVPVNMDGREVARVTAPYAETELIRRQTRESRKRGIR